MDQSSTEGPCFLSKESYEEIYKVSCKLSLKLCHLQCCSTRIKGSDNTPCHDAGEETAEAMLDLLSSVEGTVQKLKAGLADHGVFLQRRANGGRRRDSGYLSVGSFHMPTQVEEELGDLKISSSATPRQEATPRTQKTRSLPKIRSPKPGIVQRLDSITIKV